MSLLGYESFCPKPMKRSANVATYMIRRMSLAFTPHLIRY